MAVKNKNIKGILFILFTILLFTISFKFSNTQTILNDHYQEIYKQVKQMRQQTQDLSFHMINLLNTGGVYNLIPFLENAKSLQKNLFDTYQRLSQNVFKLKSLSTQKREKINFQLNIISNALSYISYAINGFQKIGISPNSLIITDIDPIVDNLKLANQIFSQTALA